MLRRTIVGLAPVTRSTLLGSACALVMLALAAHAANDAAPAPIATAPDAAHAAAAAPAGPRTYTLDNKSSLVVQTWKEGAAARLAHDHAIEARAFSGEATFDPAHPELLSISVTAQTASMVVDADGPRQRLNLPLNVPDKDKDTVTDVLKGEETLDVKKFPTVTFKSTAASVGADGAIMLTGDFTLHGVTKSVKLPVTIDVKDGGVVGKGSFKLNTSDYGIKPYSAFLGAIKVRDEVQIHLRLIGSAK